MDEHLPGKAMPGGDASGHAAPIEDLNEEEKEMLMGDTSGDIQIEDELAGPDGNMTENELAGPDGDVTEDELAGPDLNVTEDELAGPEGNVTKDKLAGPDGNGTKDELAGRMGTSPRMSWRAGG